jgi:hypothetical protein
LREEDNDEMMKEEEMKEEDELLLLVMMEEKMRANDEGVEVEFVFHGISAASPNPEGL